MRNLKKFLALVMAMVMAFSLMLTVNAAHIGTQYTDEDDVTPAFEEAMEVLTGMGVYQGDPGATFRPASTITRAETAALIYRLATGDTTDARKDLYKDYGNFADVTSTDWFAGYVGYCANAGYIKGHGGYFNPYGQVTGYEVLAMVLRAVGYDQNGEFTGATWQTNVSALSTQLGILAQVKSTHYGDRLYEASRRDVVASLLFETAQIPMVNYTAMAGYNKYTNLINNELNPTLGEKNFGLTDTTRIILGNQATGEKYTQMGAEKEGTITAAPGTGNIESKYTYNMYDYPGRAVATTEYSPNAAAAGEVPVSVGLKVDFKSGLSLFGHKTKVWYDDRASSTNSDGAQPTYAWFDKAELAKTVKSGEATDGVKLSDAGYTDWTNANAKKSLGKVAKDAGFSVNPKTSEAYLSKSFSRIDSTDTVATATNGTTSTVYVLISNNEKKTVDVMIPVETAAAQITQVDNWSATKTINLDTKLKDTNWYAVDDNTDTQYDQDDITSGTDNLKVGAKVIATMIPQNTASADQTDDTTAPPVYWLDTVPFKTVTGKVVAYDFDAATNKATVTLDDGTVLKHTIIANGAISEASGNYGVETISSFGNLTYEFQLDMQGNWLDAKPVYDNTFIYGTYIDYGTQLGSSAFTYKMVGVDLNGDVVTKDFTKYTTDNVTVNTLDGSQTAGRRISDMLVPFHSTGNTISNDFGSGLVKRSHQVDAKLMFKYRPWILNGQTMNRDEQVLWDVAGVQTLGNDGAFYNKVDASSGTVYDFQGGAAAANDTVITKGDVKLSAAQVVTQGAAGTAANPNLYLTEETKFIIVEGYGTDSLKVTKKNGISDLLGSANSVTLNTSIDTWAAGKIEGEGDEMVFTCSDYQYSNTGVISKKVDTIILPKSALTYDNGNNLYFFHGDGTDVKSNVKDAGGDAFRFEGYHNGEKVAVWVDKDYVDTTDSNKLQTQKGTGNALGANKFLFLVETDDKAADGTPIYTTKAVDNTTAGSKENSAPSATEPKAICFDTATRYQADTMNSQTALLGSDLVNVANAKVANLVPDDATINSLADLNHTSSVRTVNVCVEYAEAGSKVISAIYVVQVTG